MPTSVECLFAARHPKAGMLLEECEDQFALLKDGRIAAIADGASEATFSRQWAKCLVDRFVAEPTMILDDNWLAPVRQEFAAGIDYTRLPWHALEKLGRGSYATLAGLIIDTDAAVFSMLAVGDSCVAWHSRDNGAGCFPYKDRGALPPRPYLLSSLPERNEDLPAHQARVTEQPLAEGDTHFFLMTDALAEWYLSNLETNGDPWNVLLRLSEDTMAAWMEQARAIGSLRNDDVALIIIRVKRKTDEGAAYEVSGT